MLVNCIDTTITHRMKMWFRILLLASAVITTVQPESISGNMPSYLEVCRSAAQHDWCFETFRSIPSYVYVVEGGPFFNQLHGPACAQKLQQEMLPVIKSALTSSQKLDEVGSPERVSYPDLGSFSGTTLRYLLVANDIKKRFSLPSDATIVELGGGFGGQCYILSQVQLWERYYLFDLPDVTPLITKTLAALQVSKADAIEPQHQVEGAIDLFISNYAFSECDQATQLDYVDRVIKKARRGYMLYNINPTPGALTYQEFVTLLQSFGHAVQIHDEPVKTHDGNVLITWGEHKEQVAPVNNADLEPSIVFVYLGPELPAYLRDAVYQARLFNQCPLYILANQAAIDRYTDCSNLDVELIPVEQLKPSSAHNMFAERSTINRTFRNGFWYYASERFFYVDEFIQQRNLRHVLMLEPDIMVYNNFQALMPVFTKYYHGIGVTFSNDDLAIPGLVYIRDATASHHLVDCFAQHAHEAKNDCELLALLHRESDYVTGLPIIMPAYTALYSLQNSAGAVAADVELYTNHADEFNGLFDARAFGMYLGGVDPRNTWDPQPGPGHISEYCVINPSSVTIEWKADEKGPPRPIRSL